MGETGFEGVAAGRPDEKIDLGSGAATDPVALQQLDGLRAEAKGARGVKRARLKEQLAVVDEEMLVGIQQHVDSNLRKALQRQALQDLEPFRDRMSLDVFQQAATRSADRLIREKLGLPHFVIE